MSMSTIGVPLEGFGAMSKGQQPSAPEDYIEVEQ